MPVEVVDLDLTAATGAVPKPTYTNVGFVGTASSSPPGAEFGEVNRYSSASDVADDYGSDSDVHVASQAVQQMGASFFYVVVLEATQKTETVQDGDALPDAPVLGSPAPTADTRDVVFSTAAPPSQPASGEVAINTDTGTVKTGDGTSADITYNTVSFGALNKPEWTGEINRAVMADRRMGREHIGSLNSLVSVASSAKQGVVAAGINGATAADDSTAMAEYHDVFGYVPSGDLLGVAHKSPDDVAAYIAGQLAINDPWFDPFYDGDGYPFATAYYERSLVGDPATTGTFEGGDSNGGGPVNVVINKAGTQVLSNSVSTAGASSNYAFYDVARTQDFLGSEVTRALTSLRLSQDQIPFTPAGRAQVHNVIQNTLSQYVGGGGPLASFSVTVPPIASLTDSQKASRTYAGIKLEAVLAGNVHEFSVELNLTV